MEGRPPYRPTWNWKDSFGQSSRYRMQINFLQCDVIDSDIEIPRRIGETSQSLVSYGQKVGTVNHFH